MSKDNTSLLHVSDEVTGVMVWRFVSSQYSDLSQYHLLGGGGICS